MTGVFFSFSFFLLFSEAVAVVRHESFCGLGLLFITINLGSPYPKKHLRRAQSPRRDTDIRRQHSGILQSFLLRDFFYFFYSDFPFGSYLSLFTLIVFIIATAVGFLLCLFFQP